jgi:AbrB family looped-hinge helix DNA binding protein
MAATDKLTTIVSTKGQVILPKAMRDHLGWGVGSKLFVEEVDGVVTLRRASVFPQTDIDKVFGMLKSPVGPLSLEEMDAGVAQEARRHAFD